MVDLSSLGITNVGTVLRNLSTPALYEEAIRRREGVRRPPRAARRAHRAVHRALAQRQVHRAGALERGPGLVGQGQPAVRPRAFRAAEGACSRPTSRAATSSCRTATPAPIPSTGFPSASSPRRAWHSLFARNMFLREHDPRRWTASSRSSWSSHARSFHAIPGGRRHHTRRTFIVLELRAAARPHRRHRVRRRDQEVGLHRPELPAAAAGRAADALLGQHGHRRATWRSSSGCRARARRRSRPIPIAALIGDDEHGWSGRRRVQLRGWLLRQGDPPVGRGRAGDLRHDAPLRHDPRERGDRTRTAGASTSTTTALTENTRAAYPITHIPNACASGVGGHPKNIIMLTADAFGVLPPDREADARAGDVPLPLRLHRQGRRHRAGRHRADRPPSAPASARRSWPCTPPSTPSCSARLIAEHDVHVLARQHRLDGRRLPRGRTHEIAYSRAMVSAAMSGAFKGVSFTPDPGVRVPVPDHCPDVPDELLQPRDTWRDPLAYDAKARELATMFSANFTEYADNASPEIRTAGPVVP